MDKKSLRGYNREDLMDLLLKQAKKLDAVQKEVIDLKEKIDNKDIKIQNAGSIADAAISLNDIFENAQNAANQYVYNIKNLDEDSLDNFYEKILEDAHKKADDIINKANTKAENIIEQAVKEAAILNDKTLKSCNDLTLKTNKDCKVILDKLSLEKENVLKDLENKKRLSEQECLKMHEDAKKECDKIKEDTKKECIKQIIRLKEEIDRRLNSDE